MDVKITQPDAKEVHRWIFLYIDKYGSSPVYKLSMTLASTIIWEKLPTAKDLKDIKFITLNNFLNSEIIKFKQDKLILESTHGSLEPPPKNSRCIGVYNEVKKYELTDTGKLYLEKLNISARDRDNILNRFVISG